MNKPELTICNRLLDDGFSLLTVAENKQPNVKWKDLQSNAANKDEFVNYYNLDLHFGYLCIQIHFNIL